uniref:Uncharacterized protein n=1 Tax=Amphora coffeiformis TaxID=265554 RepID=A0A6S8KGF1_9STRA|mmetsp:Transcript_10624/g.20478  ORF Transcript_10624/g.20478 Transcript_10624/m.20478 type:complete len:354 (+) Transcript_10624:56-1117(+)|eukprot:scaffold34689_cov289-Amphora_coffeaeformis.AAC.5
MPPVLDPSKSRVDGLAFIGLSLSRKGPRGHPDSVTHQEAFDFDRVQDRDYEHIFSTNDDGWLVGGGEPGPPTSYKLAAKDSAHVEIMRIGTYEPAWGGMYQKDIVQMLEEGKILIPEITVVPTAVVANPDTPPELEIRFDMVPPPNFNDPMAPLPANWQLRFIQNQLFKMMQFPSRFNPGSFHSTILRKAEFRSPEAKKAYFTKCQKVIDEWMDRGHQPIAPAKIDPSIKVIKCKRASNEQDSSAEYLSEYYRSGIWLFTDRNTITHHFLPNFLPPYDTPAKRKIILAVLKEEWDEKNLCWKSIVPEESSMISSKDVTDLPALIADYICGSAKQVMDAATGGEEKKEEATKAT